MYFFDLYISIGVACRPAYHLMKNDLRNEAYPLDWQMAYSLDTVIHLFKTKFVDFFIDIEEDKSDLKRMHRRIKDVKNNIVSIHHFSRDVEVKKAQKEFLKKMHERFNRLDVKLEKANRVVLICNRTDTIEKLQLFLKDFSVLYPHLEIKLLNIRNDEKAEANSYSIKQYVINDCLSIDEYTFKDTVDSITQEKDNWKGNVGIWESILKKYYSKYNYEMMQKVKEENKALVIYGAGKRCLELLDKFEKYNIQIKGIAVADIFNNPRAIRQYSVNVVEKYDKDDAIVISLAERNEAEIIRKTLLAKGYNNMYFVNDYYVLEKAF